MHHAHATAQAAAHATAQAFPTARHPAALNRAALATALAAVLLAGCASRPAPAPVTVPPSMPAPTAPVAPVQPEPATAPDAAQQAEATSFEAWKRDFARKALDAGISEKTVRSALEPARLQRRAVQLDRSQPEFTRTPWQTWTAPYRPSALPRAVPSCAKRLHRCSRPASAMACRPR